MAILLVLALSTPAMTPDRAASFPGPDSGHGTWTGEVAVGLAGASQAQAVHSNGYLVMAADNGQDVYLYRASDELTLNWGSGTCMDVDKSRQACDPYLAASGKYVALSFKEKIDGRWALVIRCSWDGGATWPKTYIDAGSSWSNYEAHLAMAGNMVHAAYVSDYPGRNEVYYLRLDLSLNRQAQSCASDAGDGRTATTPCIEASGEKSAAVYYSDGSGDLRSISQAWTSDGSSWGRNLDLIPTGGGTDMTWPECCAFTVNGERRVALVCDGKDGAGAHHVYYRRYRPSAGWEEKITFHDNNTDWCYPQIAAQGSDLMLTLRGSAASDPAGGLGYYNASCGENDGWNKISGLFYKMMPCDHPASTDCLSDGTRFFALAVGTGTHAGRVLTKREDTKDPTVSINDPGKYQRGSFHVSATAADDFKVSGDWLLSPSSEKYQDGIVWADFSYRTTNGSWKTLYHDPDAPWDAYFNVSSLSDGTYDFRVQVQDTAGRGAENILEGIVLDRKPPSVELQVSAPDGENGWYVTQPSFGPAISATDSGSGVKASYYRMDGASSWTVYSKPFALEEGEHTVSYYAEDKAGNVSATRTFSYRADFTDPEGEIASPSSGIYFQKALAAKVACSDAVSGVAAVTWLVDGAPLCSGPELEATLDLSRLADGEHTLIAEIKDRAGRKRLTTPVHFYKDTTPPTVDIVEPTGKEWLRGMVAVKADVRDNLKVAGVAFFVDGKQIDERTSPPWTAAWDTSTVVNGYHAVSVQAWDAAGNRAEVQASGEVTVYVGNNISETNHFAEGCTREGFDTWLCLQNPGDSSAEVTVNYYLGEGQGQASMRTYSLPAHSRSTVYVNGDVGSGKDVSIQVTSNRPIVSERPMYFSYAGEGGQAIRGGHTAQGAQFPRREWYFAEGCTREGFDTWLCLQNPQGQEAQVRVEYLMEGGASLVRTYRLAPWSRGTIPVDAEAGAGHDVSMRVTSDLPIVAERPVYFLYQGMWDGGHNVMGAARPEQEWYFAEGCTRTGFNQWICLMNPSEKEARARITYVMEDGGRIEREYSLAPRSRFTVNVNNDVARQHDVSVTVTSEVPIVVERPMYFLYNSVISEGSNAMGVAKPGSSWYLAEGCTRAGFEEWICLLNPGDEEARVALRFMLEDTSQREHAVSVPPRTRVTVKVNDVVGPEHDVACEVMSDRPVVVERPMYSMYRGSCPAADTLSGYTFNP
ncbi:MAG: sensory rhodopsin transducer [Actinomycetota bacterium]|nr:sensory rhodopsin transducer [Actinomycetota bacterium]